jgi:GT2 family glycosyltransferase
MVSIIIACRFRPDLTRVCIDSISAYTSDFELILVQEGEDKEMQKLLKSYPRFVSDNLLGIQYVQNKVPKGYAGALNAGLAVAKGDYFCFMNNDTVATPGWMEEMLRAFEDEKVGLVSPTFWGTGDRQSVDWNTGEQFDYPLDPCSIIGVCYLIPKVVMDVVGAWDESFGHGGEDFDMTIRMQNAGYKLCIARKAFIYHYGGASTRIVIGNDLAAVRKNQLEKIMLVEKKHGVDIRSKFIKNA